SNTGTCTFTVQVADNTPPSIQCGAGTFSAAANSSCQYVLANLSAATTSSDNCGTPTISQTPAVGTVLGLGATTVTMRATDANSNTATCLITVTVTDQTPPSITCPANATVAAGANCSATLASYTAAATASDNCTASPAKTQSPATGTVLPLGAQIVTLTATDAAGNPGTCSFTVTVTDQTAPSITCPNSITQANTTNQCGANVSFANATATDNCTASPTITNLGAASGSFFPVGTTSVTFRATDGAGNSSTCSFTVTVNDTQAPNISCPANITQNSAANQCGANVSFANATATDNCTASPAITNLGAASGSFFSVGTTTVTFRATDGAGNSSTCSFTIMVKDVTPPTIVCPANQNIFASSTCTGTVGSWSPLSLTDNCSPAPTFAQSPVASTGLSGHNDSKTVTLTATDASGNTASCSFTVTLKDVTPPVAKCKNATINLGANGALTLQPGSVNNGSTDNCAFTLSVTPNTFGCSNLGNTTVTLKATDAGGNTSTCTAVVTIKDATAPTALCKTINVYLNETGHASITAADVNNNSYDACGISSMSINYNQFDCGQIGGSPVYVQLTLKDASNNTSSCLASVYVKDAIAPNAVCTNTTVTLSATGFATVQTAPLAANSTDNCSVTSYSPVAKVYTASNIGVNNLTITVKDFSGNSDACVSQITVLPYGSNMPAPPTSSDQAETHEIAHDSWQGVERLDLSVFPNPTQDASTVMFSLPKEQDYRLRLFDLNGRQILDLDFHGYPGDNSVVLELGELSPGVYLIDVQSAEMHGREKLLLQR
ncbi:MAG TPA: HYR domain-containing protein, partial [Saprospiraceae bacterium]|nr:HYR domain-containing protein [Saprospiraceae bacterium]